MSANTSNHREQSEAESSDASGGWRSEYAYQAVEPSIEPDIKGSRRDHLEAADRSEAEESFENPADTRRKR